MRRISTEVAGSGVGVALLPLRRSVIDDSKVTDSTPAVGGFYELERTLTTITPPPGHRIVLERIEGEVAANGTTGGGGANNIHLFLGVKVVGYDAAIVNIVSQLIGGIVVSRCTDNVFEAGSRNVRSHGAPGVAASVEFSLKWTPTGIANCTAYCLRNTRVYYSIVPATRVIG